MKIRIESYDEWSRMVVDGKERVAGHSRDYLYDDLLELLGELGAEIELVYYPGDTEEMIILLGDGPNPAAPAE